MELQIIIKILVHPQFNSLGRLRANKDKCTLLVWQ